MIKYWFDACQKVININRRGRKLVNNLRKLKKLWGKDLYAENSDGRPLSAPTGVLYMLLGLEASSGGYTSHGYTSHASPRACGARLGQIVKSVYKWEKRNFSYL